jgi:hypothetical protein
MHPYLAATQPRETGLALVSRRNVGDGTEASKGSDPQYRVLWVYSRTIG